MKDELVERLRETWCGHYGMDERHAVNPDGLDAIARIQAQASEIARLREAIEKARIVLSETPELNMSNYNEDDVSALNAGMIQVYIVLDAAALTKGQVDEG